MSADIPAPPVRFKLLAAEMLLRGVGLAIGCTVILFALLYLLAMVTPYAAFAIVPLGAIAHGFFIVTLTDWGMRFADGDANRSLLRAPQTGVAGAMAIGLPLIGLLADLPPWMRDLPYMLIGWTLLVIAAAPARLATFARGRRVALRPLADRLPGLAAAALPIWVLGYLFNDVPGGMMEGGLFQLPFVALYLFTASYLAALLAAVAVIPVQTSPARSG